MPEAYRTVAGPAEARFEIQGSEFIGYVAPAESVEAAEAFVADIEERHADATHNVPAYRVPAGDPSATRPGDVMLREWASDDGEPTGSAGKPALNVLVQQDVRNVVVVVTRYFGGTELGVGGLARAYSRAVKDSLEAAGVVREEPHERFSVTVDYDDSGTVRGIIESAGVEFEAHYEERASFDVRVPVQDAPDLRDRLRSATSGRADID